MLRVTTLALGSCRVPAAAAGLGGLGRTDLPALATLIEVGGARVLVDAGYGPAFLAATRAFPARLYRWATPVRLPDTALPDRLGGAPDLVMLTHMHADHVAGLPDLPAGVPVTASAAAIAHLRGLGDLAPLHAACPALLRDAVLARDPAPIEDMRRIETGLPGFPVGHDLLGDGRLLAVPLPGHGVGQTGLWIREAARFLIADAAFSRAALRSGRLPPRPLLARLGDAAAYRATFEALRRLARLRPDVALVPSHCPEAAP